MPESLGAGFVELIGDDTLATQGGHGDIMMIDEDIAIVDGDIRLIDGEPSIIQTAINNMRIMHGEMITNIDRGNMAYNRRTKSSENSLRQIERDCENAILIDDRVMEVSYIRATMEKSMSCIIEFELKLYDGKIVSSNTTISLS